MSNAAAGFGLGPLRTVFYFDDYSLLDLYKYETGQAAMPFQGRVSMVPLLRLAHGKPFLVQLGIDLKQTQGQFVHSMVVEYKPEKLICYVAGVLSVFWVVGITACYGWERFRELWWLPPALYLATLYASYGARADQNLWYPYDLPHAAFFTTGLLALLAGSFWGVAAAFAVNCPTRETATYLIPCVPAVGYARRDLRRYSTLAAGLFAFRLPVYLLIAHHFKAIPSDVGLHYHQDAHAILQPKHLPQVASAVGFLALPVFLWRRLLDRDQHWLLLGTLPGFVFSGVLGIWYETRVWSEWNAIAACLAAGILMRYLDDRRTDGLLQPERAASSVSPLAAARAEAAPSEELRK